MSDKDKQAPAADRSVEATAAETRSQGRGHPPPHPLPEPRDMIVQDGKYQPSRNELREDMDMPGLTQEQVRRAFARPFRFVPLVKDREGKKS